MAEYDRDQLVAIVRSLRRLWAMALVNLVCFVGAVAGEVTKSIDLQTVQVVFVVLTLILAGCVLPLARTLGATKFAAWMAVALTAVVPLEYSFLRSC